MKKSISVYLSVLFIIGLLFGCAEKANQASAEDDLAAIKELCDNYTKYAMAKDIDNFMACFTDDVIRAEPGKPPLIGKDRIRERFEGMWAEPGEFTLKRHGEFTADICGDQAYGFNTFTLSSFPPDGGPPNHIDMNVLTVFKQQEDGLWKIHIDCLNFFPSWTKDTIPEELLQENDPYY